MRLLPPRLAAAILHNTDQAALRSFAVACARRAVIASRIEEPILLRALEVANDPVSSAHPDELAYLRQEVAARLEHLDELAFRAQEAFERDGGTGDDYIRVFRTARAATSVLRALEDSADLAAAEACYEAFHALDESQAEGVLLEIARRELLQ
jgi:hypothetical protein